MTEELKFMGFSKTWPRPRIKCQDCNNEIVLKWGEKKRPHFSHFSSGNKKRCYSKGESAEHRVSKIILAELIQLGCLIRIHGKCKTCGSPKLREIKIEKNDKVEVEYKYNNEISDICILRNNEIYIIIEVYYKHHIRNRTGIKRWYELQANEILVNIGNNDINNIQVLNLTCIREREDCKGQECISMLDLCEKLQYGGKENEISYEINKVMYKKKQIYFHFWIQPMWKEENDVPPINENKLWNIFLKRKQCMSCKKSCETLRYKPFCISCFNKIRKGCDSLYSSNDICLINPDIDKYNSQEEIDFLKNKYSFLYNIEIWEDTFLQTQCQICNIDLLNEYRNPINYCIPIKWPYSRINRKICDDCVKNVIDNNITIKPKCLI